MEQKKAKLSPHVLVSGAGLAGSVLAYWLAKGGIQVTVVERTPALRTAGQGIDIEGPGLDVVQKMELESTIQSKTTGETGFAIVDQTNRIIAAFDVGNKNTDIGLTSKIEIMRGDLADIFYRAAAGLDRVEFRFDCAIENLTQTEESVLVEFTNNSKPKEFDMVIAADGLGSRTRDLMLDIKDRRACIKSLNAWIAYFTIPREDRDGPRSRAYNAIGTRVVFIRPRDARVSSALLGTRRHADRLYKASREGIQAQKAVLAELFADAGWEAPRMISQMKDSEDFYLQEVAQVKLDGQWHRGRCALVGDAAYCPSGFTGKGTTLAILGAYVLAGEIVRSPQDPTAAFEAYESKLRTYVEKSQKVALGGWLPSLLNPETAWGIWLMRTVVRFVAWSGIVARFGGFRRDTFDLPDYRFEAA